MKKLLSSFLIYLFLCVGTSHAFMNYPSRFFSKKAKITTWLGISSLPNPGVFGAPASSNTDRFTYYGVDNKIYHSMDGVSWTPTINASPVTYIFGILYKNDEIHSFGSTGSILSPTPNSSATINNGSTWLSYPYANIASGFFDSETGNFYIHQANRLYEKLSGSASWVAKNILTSSQAVMTCGGYVFSFNTGSLKIQRALISTSAVTDFTTALTTFRGMTCIGSTLIYADDNIIKSTSISSFSPTNRLTLSTYVTQLNQRQGVLIATSASPSQAYYSLNGTTWTRFDSDLVASSKNYYLGAQYINGRFIIYNNADGFKAFIKDVDI